MSSIKKSWFEKAVGNIGAVTGVNPQRLAEIIAEADVTSTDVTFSQLADQVISDLAVELGVPAEMAAGLSQLSVQVCNRLADGAGDRIIPADRVEHARGVLTATIRDALIALKAGGEITPKGAAAATIVRAACAEQGLPAALTEEMVAAVTAQSAAEPTTTVVVASVVEPTPVVTVTAPAVKSAAHVAVKKAAAKKGKPIKALSDMDELKAKLAA